MAKTTEEQLADVQTALEAVETRGQRFKIRDREVWRADIGDLDKRQERLERKASREARGGTVRVQRIVPL